MHYRPLGRSGLRVSPLCLGTMMFGGPTPQTEALAIIAKAKEAGINFIDTADMYQGGESEVIVGRALASDRHHWILATKAANPTGSGPNARGLSRRHVVHALEASLQRLKLDHVDIFYLHKEDLETPLEETIRAVADVVRQGKTRYFGLSNFRSWRVALVCQLCDQAGIDRPVVSQPYYNLLNRMPEVEHLPACGHFGLGVVPYSPLARGVLTGKYTPDQAPGADTRAGRQDKRMLETEWRPESLAIAQTLKAHAEATGRTPIQFAVAWLLHHRLVSAVIAGPRTLEQWRAYMAALEATCDAADEALVDGLVPPGHPSTPGYSDPAYPLEGRLIHRRVR
ncbi:MAG: aldo/keto reductase [Candidatus Competibacterales bacterium]